MITLKNRIAVPKTLIRRHFVNIRAAMIRKTWVCGMARPCRAINAW
jgi:hypothetical protein